MLHHILLVTIFLGPCLIFGDSETEKSLKKILDQPYLLDEAINASVILSDCNYERDDLKRIIVCAIKTLRFFEVHLDDMVIDAAIGTRVMQSQLNLLQAGHPNIPKKLQKLLTKLQLMCKRLSDEIIDNLWSKQLTTEERDELIENLPWVDDADLWESPSSGSWQSPSTSITNKTMESLVSQKEVMNETISDKCTSDIFHGCSVTDECAKLFLENIYSKYTLTHQLFYFYFAEKKKCFNDEHFKQKMGSNDSTQFMHLMCNKVWEEANEIENSNFPEIFRDLLAEQVFVCSLLGYTQFLKLSWLENILSWQNRIGCFLEPNQPNILTDNRRVKRSDNVVLMGDEKCSVHFTTVSLCTMAMHLRYFGDTCLQNY